MAAKPMFPDKARMIRSANALGLVLFMATVVYLVIGATVKLVKLGSASGQTFVLSLFLSWWDFL